VAGTSSSSSSSSSGLKASIRKKKKKKEGNKYTHTHMGGNLVLSHHVTLENFHVNCCEEEEEEDDDDEEGVMNIQTGLAG
jgi:hypothetical protein